MLDNSSYKVCVIGAGTMGGGIAGHLANLGFQVMLLDASPESAVAGLDRLRAARPPHLYTPDHASRIRVGSIDAQLGWVSEADWVCEAIVEKADAKKGLYALIEPHIRPDAFVSTNTSGLEISLLAQGRADSFQSRFVGTHFFNPPRYLKLIELIPTPSTSAETVERMTRFLEDRVGRRVVLAKDTPGFIANRFGMWAMFQAIHVAEKLRLTVEQVDAMTGPFLGRPRSASFRLNDLVGLDIMADIAKNLRERCVDDPHRETLELPSSLQTLLDRGSLGDKVGRGYYRREGKQLNSLDLGTLAYRERQEPDLPSLDALSKRPLGERIAAALDLGDDVGEFMRRYLVPTLRYADYLKDRISHGIEDFDRVMMWGFGWEVGPFALIDAIGPEKLGLEPEPRYTAEGVRSFDGHIVPRRSEPQYRSIADFPMVDQAPGLVVRQLEGDVFALCLTTKMGTLNPSLVEVLIAKLAEIRQPMVLCSEARSFSAGFDLHYFVECAEGERWDDVMRALERFQILSAVLSRSRIVAAVHGHALGGGMEVAMGCPLIVAHPEASMGLPEAKLGLMPAGCGTTLLRVRRQGSLKELVETAKTLVQGQTSSCAEDARRLGYLRPSDVVLHHPDRLIHDAALAARTVQPIEIPAFATPEGPLTGMVDRAIAELVAKGDLTQYDEVVSERIKNVVCRSTSFEEALRKEREGFVDLLKHPMTQARIRHMIETGKPLRN